MLLLAGPLPLVAPPHPAGRGLAVPAWPVRQRAARPRGHGCGLGGHLGQDGGAGPHAARAVHGDQRQVRLDNQIQHQTKPRFTSRMHVWGRTGRVDAIEQWVVGVWL